MSVAQKDGIDQRFLRRPDLLRRSLPALGGGELEGDRDRLLRGSQGLGVAERDPAQVGAVDLLDVLLRGGLGHRQPLPLHRRRAAGGAEVLPRHPAGGRGAPRGLLPPLLQGGDRRRRVDRLDARLHRAAARVGLPQRVRPPRPDGRGASQGPLAAQVRAGDRALPHGRRGGARPAGAALHRGLLQQGRDDARVQRGDAQRLARRAAPHRLRGQGARRTASARARSARRRWSRSCARCCPGRCRCSCRRAGISSTPAATASSSRTSTPSACARSRRSGRRPATRSRRCPPTSSRSTSRSRTSSGRSGRSRCCARASSASRWQTPDSSPETQALLFDVIARSADSDAVNGQPVTIQWRFTDAAPVVRADRQRQLGGGPGRGPGPEPDPGDVVAGLARGLDLRRRPAARDAAPQAPAARLATGCCGGCSGSSRAEPSQLRLRGALT